MSFQNNDLIDRVDDIEYTNFYQEEPRMKYTHHASLSTGPLLTKALHRSICKGG
jgi:hypothetical protein